MLKGKTILLGVTGGIAAYKSAYLASALVKLHANVEVVMTEHATRFIAPLTFEQLTGRRCMVDTFDRNFSHQVEHIALAEFQPPLTLLDLGTATTIEVVGKGNAYLGGCIIPGVRVSLEALTSRTAQLPGIRLDKPKKVIGKNTIDCMRSGIMYGTAAMIDGMLDRVEEELGYSTTVVATGGMAQFVVPLCRRKIQVDRDLLLKGLNIIYKKNATEHKHCET